MEVTIALANYPITAHTSFEAWKKHVGDWISKAIEQGAQVLTFPEYGSMELTSLFPENVHSDLNLQLNAMQELLPGFLDTFRDFARMYRCTIVAPSFPVWLGEKYVNRAYVFTENDYAFQDKQFMTRFEDEIWGISASDNVLRLFDTPHGRFGIQICFDIEFPLGGHLLAEAGADYILVPSCTETLKGATRVHIGARARAMEQQFFTGVSQTMGEALWSPAVDLNYGYTAVYSTPDGDFPEDGILASSVHQEEGWLIHTIDLDQNTLLRQNGQVLNFKHSQRQQINLEDSRIELVNLKKNLVYTE